MQVDHIIPEAAGGKTEIANLWLACVPCNQRKAYRTHARDPHSGQIAPLFNPAKERWSSHFQWSEDGTETVGSCWLASTAGCLAYNLTIQDECTFEGDASACKT